jgi:SWIM zinc finger
MTPSEARARERAISQNVWVEPQADGMYLTPSISRPGQFHTVTVDRSGHAHCDCSAGVAGKPCKHAAAVCMHIYEEREIERAKVRAQAMKSLEEWF